MSPDLRKGWLSVDGEDEQGPAQPIESAYEHVGLDHLQSLGDASASLGLISTLVFSLCIGSIVQFHTADHELSDLFMTMSTLSSTYTTTYSLLEYYYLKTLKGLDDFIAQRHFPRPRLPSDASARSPEVHAPTGGAERELECGEGVGGIKKQHSRRGSQGIAQDRAELVEEVEEAFATFNDMRTWARNSMWLSLVSLVSAALCKIDPLGAWASTATSLPPAVKTAGFFGVLAFLFVVAQCIGFRSRDIVGYTYISVSVLALSALGGFLHTAINTTRLSSGGFLIASVCVVPITVRSFRCTFLDKVQRHASIY